MTTFFHHPAWRGAWSGALCGIVAGLLSLATLLAGLDDWLFDSCFVWRGPRSSATRSQIVLVGLDEASFKALNKPWVYLSPELAQAVTFLHEQGAAAIGLDLIIPDDLKGLPGLATDEGDAGALGRSIEQAGGVVLAHFLNGAGGQPLDPLPPWLLKHYNAPAPTDLAFVDTSPDNDQFVRRQRLYYDQENLHFALALLMQAQPESASWPAQGLNIDGASVPLDSQQRLRINFVGAPGETFRLVPFHELLAAARGEPLLGRSDLEGAIIILGDVTRGQHDVHATPYANRLFQNPNSPSGGLMAGAELHANVLATLLDKTWITTPVWLSTWPLVVVVGAALGLIFARLSLPLGAILAAGFSFLWQAVGVAVFCLTNWRLPLAPLMVVGVLAYGATFGVRWMRLRKMFGVVKSSAIARLLENGPEGMDLRGEDRIVTVLFADVRNFTGFSEAHSAREVVTLLNTYFTAIVPLIEQQGGTLNHYIGDGIMVLYGAPQIQADHALRAVRTAVEIIRRVHEMRSTWEQLDCPTFRIGVGIHTGPVVVGTVGSRQRLDYTAIGDTINTAARLEAETKNQGCEILISHETYKHVPRAERQLAGCAEDPTTVHVKGKDRAVEVYRVEPKPN